MKKYEIDCPDCDAAFPSTLVHNVYEARDIKVFNHRYNYWIEVKCKDCWGWVQVNVSQASAFDIIRSGAPLATIQPITHGYNEMAQITNEYIEDFLWEMDDDPCLVKILEWETA